MIVHNEKEKDGDDRSPAKPGSDLERASSVQVDIDNF
jgi:hypothetical protein